MVVASEDFDGKLFKNASSSHSISFLTGMSAYPPFEGQRYCLVNEADFILCKGLLQV